VITPARRLIILSSFPGESAGAEPTRVHEPFAWDAKPVADVLHDDPSKEQRTRSSAENNSEPGQATRVRLAVVLTARSATSSRLVSVTPGQ
jgi:hypothetical protein